ncbi:NACHT domain-containing protein [Streptomyces sp. NPDC006487]|uniref:NACHT domain-containing protein n=1 Tax=Streptomyces sp. NPDC006487 TaxID=3364748 RepID=UPI003692B7FD
MISTKPSGHYCDSSPSPSPRTKRWPVPPRVLLRGEAGSGKTTLVQWLTVSAAQQDRPDRPAYLRDRIPFVLPLRTLTRHGERLPTPKDFLAAVDCPLTGSQPAGWEHRVLTAGRGLVLVDGIDEVPEPERERTRRWLRDLIGTYDDNNNRWLVTSRPSAVGQDWLAEEGFGELTLSSMGPADTATFVKRWHAAALGESESESAAELKAYEAQLLTAVRTKADLGRLATNPLMCGLICALHRDRRGYLPHGRKDLYEAALSMLISRRDRERDMKVPDLREEPQLELLQRLAYWLIKNGRTEMDRSQAEDIIGRALPAVPEAAALGAAPAVFDHFLQRSGLLREPAPGTVDFIHRTFQDFLGARAAVEEGDFGLLTAHAANDQWEDVIRMAVALARPRERVGLFEELVSLGDRTADRRTRDRVYLLAAACLEHATTLEPSVREAVEQRTATLIPPRDFQEARALAEVGPLILDLLPGPEDLDIEAAFHVVIAASHVTSDAALPFLARFAQHPGLPIRSQLMWAWARYDQTRYADEVIARLEPAGLDYTVTSDEQLEHLERLGARPHSLDVRPGVSAASLDSYLSRHALAKLTFSDPMATDLHFLRTQPEIEVLDVEGSPRLVDLSALGGLPVRTLRLRVGFGMNLDQLSQLTELESLTLSSGSPDSKWSPDALPAHAPLSHLHIEAQLRPKGGLTGLRRLSRLAHLHLCPASSPSSAADWHEICGLPDLTLLTVGSASFGSLPSTAILSEVFDLFVNAGTSKRGAQDAIDRLPRAFPRLRQFQFSGADPTAGDIDVPPLATLPDLQVISIDMPRDRVHGTASLPAVTLHTAD